jgi:hypothetical protein
VLQPYVYNKWYLYSFLDDCLLSWMDSNPTRTTDGHLKRIISTNCCIHTVVPPDYGLRYARNMYRLTKYTKSKLCIKLVFSLHDYIEMHGQQNIKYIANIPCHHKYLIPTLKTTAAFDWTVLVLYCHYDITR